MFSLLVASRQLYGDFLVDLIAHLLYPSSHLKVDLRTSDFKETTSSGLAASLASWLNLLSGMTMAIFLILLVFLLLFLSALHIPLPSEICDRKKIQMFEFVLRLSNEYLVGYFWKTLP
uniref:Uncharacterized protein n=1 Tax=Ditylenchus dipsaci TaxID=166011 RepID=A0A915DWT8_9BILA